MINKYKFMFLMQVLLIILSGNYLLADTENNTVNDFENNGTVSLAEEGLDSMMVKNNNVNSKNYCEERMAISAENENINTLIMLNIYSVWSPIRYIWIINWKHGNTSIWTNLDQSNPEITIKFDIRDDVFKDLWNILKDNNIWELKSYSHDYSDDGPKFYIEVSRGEKKNTFSIYDPIFGDLPYDNKTWRDLLEETKQYSAIINAIISTVHTEMTCGVK